MPDRSLKNYEAMVILNPTLTDADIETLIGRLTAALTEAGATLRETARWGRRKLAYPIAKKNDGYYVIFYFTLQSSGPALAAFERLCRYDENVLRHMIINVPLRKRGRQVVQLVPAPGWKADFKLEARPHVPRRRPESIRAAEPAAPEPAATAAEPAAAPDAPPASDKA